MTKYTQKYQDKDHLKFIEDFKPVIQEMFDDTYHMVLSGVVNVHANGFAELIDKGIHYAKKNGFSGYKNVREVVYLPNEERIDRQKFLFDNYEIVSLVTAISIVLLIVLISLFCNA